MQPAFSQVDLRLPEKLAKDLNFTPLPHQTALSDKLDDESGQLVFHGLGSGKTKSIVNAAHEHGLPLVAIVPAALRDNMRKELHTSGFKQPSMVLSYEEALKKMHDPEFLEHASKSLVAFDEAHRGSSELGQRRKLLEKLPAQKKLLATATPARNEPAELAPLINSIEPDSLPNKATEFNKKFIDTRTKPVGFYGWLTGQKGEKVRQPKNLHEFEKAVKGKVDFYQAADRSQYPTADEHIVEVPMAPKQQAAYDMVMGKYPMLWYKIRHGLPATKRDEADFKAFMSGPRQVMNHPGPYNSSATDEDAPKITAAVDEIEKRIKKDKNFRGVAYSAYLDTGVHPLSRELDRRGIPHAMFTGEQDETERKHIVESYNKGKLPVLLVSGAGSEGLDLKGTKLMQILEPHWNEELIDQVRGRAIRYKSHSHLPADQRHVEVQRFHAVPAPNWMDRMLGRSRSSESSADEYLYNKAKEKRETLRPFLEILKGRPASEVEAEMKQAADAAPGAIMCDTKWNTPGILLDLDGTLVHTSGPWGPGVLGTQQVLPRRLETLRLLKARGYKLIGITNRTAHWGLSEMELMQLNQETMEVTEGLLDDILCCPEGDKRIVKPSPTMLLQAMQQYHLDPENTVMVGDSPESDEGAANNAGIPFVFADAFFTADWANVPHAIPHPAPEVLGSRRWVDDGLGNLVGTLACNGQEAVNALRKKIMEHAESCDLPMPELIVSDEVLKIKMYAYHDNFVDFAAWIDDLYEERDAGLAPVTA
ncbi:MAG: HAD-IIIA family hydrolase [Phycisphaerae bacterium]|jgi:HAD superfamily hydrolase (TIGR01662 family)